MSASSSDPLSRRQKYIWGASIAVLILVLFVTFSRKRSGPASADPDRGQAGKSAEAELRKQLLATLDGLRPERLHVSSDEQNTVGDLNLWWAEFAQTAEVSDAEEFAALVGQWLGDDAAANVAAARFTARDAAHIRNALLYRAIAASLVRGYASDRERRLAAFQLVVRQISLMSAFAEPAPLGSCEVLLAGRGEPDDRIWVYAEVLRQLGIDCVVFEPKEAVGDAPVKLVGAIIDDEGVLLFDPQLGLPIPKLDDTSEAIPSSAASYGDALHNDELFRQFDIPGGTAYPWSSSALAECQVRFVLDSTYAAPRMLTLQSALPEEFAATLFDGPALSDDSPSLEARVIAAGADGLWSDHAVTAWQYPERQMQAFFAAGGEASPDARNRLATLYGPKVLVPRKVERDGQFFMENVAVEVRRPLRMVRVQHLSGDVGEALLEYGKIRFLPLDAGNAEVREDAVHWIAVCQAELERYDAAVDTLTLLLRDYPNGIWYTTSQRSLACGEALRGNLQTASELMPRPAEGQAPNLGDAYLVRRWQSQATTSSSTADTPSE